MTPMEDIKSRNEQEWSKIILKAQIQQLRRERFHLKSKSQERQLTIWERMRLDQVISELKQTVEEINILANLSERG